MLKCSRNAIRYHPPTREMVIKQCLIVYAFALFVASWSNWGVSETWWPIRNNVYSGVFCLPMPYDFRSTLFFYLLYAPLVFFLPLFYICYVVFDIAKNKLLPHREQRKTLMIFFRLLLVYFVMWVPALFLTFVAGNWLSWPYVTFGAIWAHLQGAVSAATCIQKPDIQVACKNLVFCCTRKKNQAVLEPIPTTLEKPAQIFLGIKERSASINLNDEEQQDEVDDNADKDDDAAHKSDTTMTSSSRPLRRSAYEIAFGLEAGELHSIPPFSESASGNV
ncbi:unnamed protein product [Cylindrotheca closterium]|uniref:Uncharacterized protein n=1 Tax=Cylindrotheca closterium TaxID=2856 RepID=A0AAD2GCC1_9STRA|nr:unnamed protein product [Cylindrotheca closterium]